MKKLFALVMMLCIALSISACDNNEDETNSTTVSTNVSTTEPITVTTTEEETTQSTNPFDYIKKPSDLLNDLKPLLSSSSCDIDSYDDYSSDSTCDIHLIGDYENKIVMIHNSSYYTEDSDIIGFGPNKSTLLINNDSLIVYGGTDIGAGKIFDAVLINCPDEYKMTSEEMRKQFNDLCIEMSASDRATWTINDCEFVMEHAHGSTAVSYSINWY